jgi:hypothetical protein
MLIVGHTPLGRRPGGDRPSHSAWGLRQPDRSRVRQRVDRERSRPNDVCTTSSASFCSARERAPSLSGAEARLICGPSFGALIASFSGRPSRPQPCAILAILLRAWADSAEFRKAPLFQRFTRRAQDILALLRPAYQAVPTVLLVIAPLIRSKAFVCSLLHCVSVSPPDLARKLLLGVRVGCVGR